MHDIEPSKNIPKILLSLSVLLLYLPLDNQSADWGPQLGQWRHARIELDIEDNNLVVSVCIVESKNSLGHIESTKAANPDRFVIGQYQFLPQLAMEFSFSCFVFWNDKVN